MQDRPSDITDAATDGSADRDGTMPPPGQNLRLAREAAGISIDEISHDLHLDRDVVLALEADDYESLGAPVFVRGYLRSYARRLNMDEDSVVAGFKVVEPEPEEFRTLSRHKEVKPGASLANFLLWVLAGLVVLAGFVYLVVGDEPAPIDEVDKGEFVAPAEPAETVPLPEPDQQVGQEVDEQPAIFEIEKAAEEAAVVMPIESDPVVEVIKTVGLSFSFTEECWLEVTDAENRLLYGVKKPGDVVSVEGVPPFRLFLGNANGVSITLQGKDFPIPPASRSGNKTARFVITDADVPAVTEQ